MGISWHLVKFACSLLLYFHLSLCQISPNLIVSSQATISHAAPFRLETPGMPTMQLIKTGPASDQIISGICDIV